MTKSKLFSLFIIGLLFFQLTSFVKNASAQTSPQLLLEPPKAFCRSDFDFGYAGGTGISWRSFGAVDLQWNLIPNVAKYQIIMIGIGVPGGTPVGEVIQNPDGTLELYRTGDDPRGNNLPITITNGVAYLGGYELFYRIDALDSNKNIIAQSNIQKVTTVWCVADLQVRVKLDGKDYKGTPVYFDIKRSEYWPNTSMLGKIVNGGYIGSTAWQTFSVLPPGTYYVSYVSGGPTGAGYTGDPAPQTFGSNFVCSDPTCSSGSNIRWPNGTANKQTLVFDLNFSSGVASVPTPTPTIPPASSGTVSTNLTQQISYISSTLNILNSITNSLKTSAGLSTNSTAGTLPICAASTVTTTTADQLPFNAVVSAFRYYQDLIYNNPPSAGSAAYNYYSPYERLHMFIDPVFDTSTDSISYGTQYEIFPACYQTSTGSSLCHTRDTSVQKVGPGGINFHSFFNGACGIVNTVSQQYGDYSHADACKIDPTTVVKTTTTTTTNCTPASSVTGSSDAIQQLAYLNDMVRALNDIINNLKMSVNAGAGNSTTGMISMPTTATGSGIPPITVNASVLNVRQSPNTQAAILRQLKAGNTFNITCYVAGENVEGSSSWWQTTDGAYIWAGGTVQQPSSMNSALCGS